MIKFTECKLRPGNFFPIRSAVGGIHRWVSHPAVTSPANIIYFIIIRIIITVIILITLRGAFNFFWGKSWNFVPTGLTPPPLSPQIGTKHIFLKSILCVLALFMAIFIALANVEKKTWALVRPPPGPSVLRNFDPGRDGILKTPGILGFFGTGLI